MVQIIIIPIDSKYTEKKIDNVKIELICKACGFRKIENFDKRYTWKINTNEKTGFIELWSRNFGKEQSINKCELPPPIDKEFYYGKMAVIYKDNDGNYCDLSIAVWEKIYESLFGGFYNINDTISEDENEIDELQDVDPRLLTSTGYLKDDFVVDDDDISIDSQLELEEYIE